MLGVDVGTHSVKLVSISRGVVQGLRLARYPQGPSNTKAQAPSVLKRLVAQLSCNGQRAWGSVQGGGLIVRLSEFPSMPEHELRNAVALEAEGFVSGELSAMDLDYDIIDTLPDGKLRVLFVAAPRELSDRKMECFRSAGLYCVGITADSLAVTTAFLNAATESHKQGMALLVNIGVSTTNIALVNAGTLAVLREVPFGGNEITEAIAAELGVDFEEAERLKLEPGGAAERLAACVTAAAEPLMQQIARTVGYETRRSEETERVVVCLSGGGSLAPGLSESIQNRFGFQVDVLDPFANLKAACELPDDVRSRCLFAVAVGTALAGEQQS